MTCARGNCKLVVCTAKSCLLSCPEGKCALTAGEPSAGPLVREAAALWVVPPVPKHVY